MNAEPQGIDLGTEPDDLVEAAGVMVLAIEGIGKMLEDECPGKWASKALLFGARRVLDRAERVAAAIDERPTRWMTGLPELDRRQRHAVPVL